MDTTPVGNHSTPAELQAKIDALESGEAALVTVQPTTPPVTPPVTPPAAATDPPVEDDMTVVPPVVPVEDDMTVVPPVVPPVEPVIPPDDTNTAAPVTPLKPGDIDYEARYAGSTREAQILAAKNKQLTETIDAAAAISDPTDDDMKKEYGTNWETMDDVTKKLAKDAYVSTRRFKLIHEASLKNKNIDDWQGKVKSFVENPTTKQQFPQLEGREYEFTQFASMPTRVGVNFEDLVRSFSFDIKPIKRQTPGSSLFSVGGGGAPAPNKAALTEDDIKIIRETKPKKYAKLVKEGKINIQL